MISQAAPEDILVAAQQALVQLDQLAAAQANDDARAAKLFSEAESAIGESRRSIAIATPATQPNDGAAARLCQLDYLQAELHRRTGLALSDSAARASQFEKAIAAYKTLRLEHRKLVAGMLGYVGEARVHLAQRDYAQAETVIAPVATKLDDRALNQQSEAQLRMQRLLWMTRVEAAILKNPLEGNNLAAQLAGSELMKNASPQEVAVMNWAVLRAQVQHAIDSKAGDASKFLAAISDAHTASTVPEHERLGLLLQLRDACKVELPPESSLQLARLLFWAQRNHLAIEAYDAASQAAAQLMNGDDWQAYGSLLTATPRTSDAAEAFSTALKSVGADSPRRIEILRAVAHARLALAQNPNADNAAGQRAIDSLWELIRSGADVESQTQAMRSICFLAHRSNTLEVQLKQIGEYGTIVKNDPYVAYMLWQSRWNSAADRDKAVVALEARAALTPLLEKADKDTAAAIVLLVAQTSSNSNDGAAAALGLIEQQQARTAGTSSAAALHDLRMALLLQLGHIEEAEKLATSNDHGTAADTLLRLATILSDRFADFAAPPQQAALRERVAALVTRGLSVERSDPQFAVRAITGSKALIKVGAYAQAFETLGGLSADDAHAGAEIAVLKAEALQGQQKFDAAVAVLEPLANDSTTGGEAMLALGDLRRKLNSFDAAAAAYRDARKKLQVGSESWWRATIGLAEVLVQQKSVDAAKEILRVADALYRSSAPPTVQKRIDAILK